MRGRRTAAWPAGDHVLLRAQPPRLRHKDQSARQALKRIAATLAMTLAGAPRTAPPEPQYVAIKPAGRDMRCIGERIAFPEGAALEKVLVSGHVFLLSSLRARVSLSPHSGEVSHASPF